MKKADLAYIAGVMDSDGCFTMVKSWPKYRSGISPCYYEKCALGQTQPEAVELIYENFGGHYRLDQLREENAKPLHSLQISNIKAHKLIKAIYPYLRIKKVRAKVLLNLREKIETKETRKQKCPQRNRWGKTAIYTKDVLTRREITAREKLFQEIKSLNK
jgi:hypothetical protein